MGDPIDREHLRITGQHKAIAEPHVDVIGEQDVVIVVTQAYGPTGANLVGISDVTFDGHAAVTVRIATGDGDGLVHLSPIHGDSRKEGPGFDIPAGTRCVLTCPVSGHPLDMVGGQ